MLLRINDEAPNFTAQTTRGEINFHEWLGDSWGVLFSHPKDFTPVCTTELGYMAGLEPEFTKRNCKKTHPYDQPSGNKSKETSPCEQLHEMLNGCGMYGDFYQPTGCQDNKDPDVISVRIIAEAPWRL